MSLACSVTFTATSPSLSCGKPMQPFNGVEVPGQAIHRALNNFNLMRRRL